MRKLIGLYLTLFGVVFGSDATANSQHPPVTSLLELRQNNVVIQEWDLSCGAAALTTLLRYQHGLDITEKEAALAMVNRDAYIEDPDLLRRREGFSLLDLKLFTDSLGLTGNGYGGLNFEHLLELAPVLIPVNIDGYNHFVIFRGIAKHRILLADPAWGNRIMTKTEFLKAWFEVEPLGRVGFTVESSKKASKTGLNKLSPTFMDFVMIQ